MSAQINLYHPRFLKQRDLLSLGNVALAVLVTYAVLAAAGGLAWRNAAARQQAASVAEAQLRATKAQLEAETSAAAARKPNPQIVGELENVEGLLRRRAEVAGLLESGAVGSSSGFAEFLRGFARQAPEGLWLTGFRIGSGGNDMEIRGSMLTQAALPDYIRRLGAEKAFQGRNFAALTMTRADPAPAGSPAGQGTAARPAPTSAPRPLDFVLMPRQGGEAKETRQ